MPVPIDSIVLAAEEITPYEIGQIVGILFWGGLAVLGMAKCRTIALRPEANAKTCNGLALVLLSIMGFMLVGWLKQELGFGFRVPATIGAFVMMIIFVLGLLFAVIGMGEIVFSPRGRYKQGFWQGITVFVLAIGLVGVMGWGFVSGLIAARNLPEQYRVEQKPKGSTYAYKDFDFQIDTIPPDWVEVNAKRVNPLACASFTRQNPQVFMIAIVETVDPDAGLTAELLAEAVKVSTKQRAGKDIVFEESDHDVAKVPGKVLTFKTSTAGRDFEYLDWVGLHDGFAYQFMFWKFQSSSGSLQAESDVFLKNFSFLNLHKVAEAEEDTGTEPPEKPLPPFALKPPADPEKAYGKYDLSTMDAGELESSARRFERSGKYLEAVQFQHWAFQKSKRGRYSLACYFARANQIDAAIYFLQEAGVYEGCDPEWMKKDNDFKVVHADPRWPKVVTFIRACARYWRANVKVQVPVICPKGYVPGTPIPVAVGLHGLGDTGENFVSSDYQWLADDLGIAIVGVSGTYANGPGSFSWAEDTEKDHQHVLKALESVRDKVTVKPGQIALFGFSQGAQRAVELAALDPVNFRGAVVMSPGSATPHAKPPVRTQDNKNQHFIIMAGDGEHPNTLKSARDDQSWAESVGAKSQLIIYEKMNMHTFPRDYNKRIGPWLREILQLPAEAKN